MESELTKSSNRLISLQAVLFFVALLYPLWVIIPGLTDPLADDPIIGRLSVSFLMMTLLLITIKKNVALKYFESIKFLAICIFSIHYFYIFLINHKFSNYMAGSFIVIMSCVVPLLYSSARSFIVYCMLILIMGLMTFKFPDMAIPPMIYFGCVVTFVIISSIFYYLNQNNLKSILKSEKMARSIIEQAQEGIILVNENTGRIQYINQSMLIILGLSESDVISKKLDELFNKKTFEREFEFVSFTGVSKFVTINFTKILVGHDRFLVYFFHDMTKEIIYAKEKRKIEKDFQQNARFLTIGFLAQGVIDEIITPVSSLQEKTKELIHELNACASESKKELPVKASNAMEQIISDSLRISQVLDILKKHTSKAEDKLENICIGEIVENVIYSMKEKYKDFNLEIKGSRHVDHKLTVCAEKKSLESVFSIIIDNAIEATLSYGNLAIDVSIKSIEDKKCIITVRDYGEGILPENQSRIFAPFFSTKKEDGKASSNLSIAYSIIKGINGEIVFETIKKQGTSFHVTLPVSSSNFNFYKDA